MGTVAPKADIFIRQCSLQLLNRNFKLKIYKSLVRSVVTYGCEAWTLTTRDEQHLRIFESKILRKIFGPIKDKDGSWRIRMNHELNELIGNADIVRFIKKTGG